MNRGLFIFYCLLFFHPVFSQTSNTSQLRAPVNDEACNATVLPVNTSCTFITSTNVNATTSPEPDPGCGNYSGGDIWFQVVVPASGNVTVTTQPGTSLNNGAMAFYTGTCNSLTQIDCDGNNAPGSGSMPELTATGLAPGSIIWIRFWEDGNNDFGTFEICATTVAAPVNDEPCNAIPLTPANNCINTIGDNTNATASSGVPAPGCGNYSGGDVWYSTIVPANGHIFVITSAGTLTNGAIALYRGTCNSLSLIACENTQGPGEWAEMSFVNLTPGETIWIRVWDENNNDEGTFNICVTSNPITPPPTCVTSAAAGDECSTATPICSLDGYCGNTFTYTYNDLGWTELLTAFQGCLNPNAQIQNNSYLKFTASSTSADFNVWVTSSTKGIGIQMMFFEAANCGSGPVICRGGYDDIRPGPEKLITATGLVPGNTYYLMIDGVSNDLCNYVIKALTPTIAPNAGTLSGNQFICITGGTNSTTFNTTSSGGTWASNNTSIATIDATGLITPIAVGSTTITYTVPGIGICPSDVATRNITVSSPPVAGTLSGIQNICSNASVLFSSTSAGGIWSSNNTSIATVNSSGQVSGVSGGTAIITYTVPGTGGCVDASTTRNIDVTNAPNAGSLSGTQNICSNQTSVFASTSTGGTWSTSDATVATIDASGNITPISTGSAIMSYTVTGTGGCADAIATRSITISAGPNAGIITGTQQLCINSTANLTTTGTGGSWSSSNTSVATVNSSGTITTVGTGNAIISYNVNGTGGCPNATATLNIAVAAVLNAGTLSGNQNLCANSTSSFSSSAIGGAWTSNNTAVATIDASGNITPVAAGNATMSYTITGTGGCADAVATRDIFITAPPQAGNLTGNQNICSNTTTNFTSSSNGGVWSSANNSIAIINQSGNITPVSSGTTTINYTVAGTGGCADDIATRDIFITPAPDAGNLSGIQNICLNSFATFASTSIGGVWSTNNAAVASVDALGNITPVSSGSAIISYTITGTGGCADAVATRAVFVTAPPQAGNISGPTTICTNNYFTFSSSSAGGSWASTNTSAATINATSGLVNPLSSGNTTLIYTVPGTGGCGDAVASLNISIANGINAGTISGIQNLCLNESTGLVSSVAGGTWSSSNSSVLSVSNSGIITGLSNGNATVTYEVIDPAGICPNGVSTLAIAVSPKPTVNELTNNAPICYGDDAVFTIRGTPGAVLSYSINNQPIVTRTLIGGIIKITIPSCTADQYLQLIDLSFGACVNALTETSIIKTEPCENIHYYIPNSFVPGSNANSEVAVFKVYGKSIKSANMKVFNQWGQLIFESDDASKKGWDGTYKGVFQPVGVYTYAVQIQFFDKTTINKTGSINLIR